MFTDVMRDVVALCKFRDRQYIQRGVWDAQVPADVKARLMVWEYVVVCKNVVYLTEVGLEVIEYRQTTGV